MIDCDAKRLMRWFSGIALGLLAFVYAGATCATDSGRIRLQGHVPAQAVKQSRTLARNPEQQTLNLSVSLPLRNTAELLDFIARVNNPADPIYGQFLTSEQFAERFGPTKTDYDAVVREFSAKGFRVSNTNKPSQLLSLQAETWQVEREFKVRMQRYRSTTGREFFAPDQEPEFSAELAARVVHLAGLTDWSVRKPKFKQVHAKPANLTAKDIGSGPQGGLSPSDIANAYDIEVQRTASDFPQTLAVVALADYFNSDIDFYRNYFSLTDISVSRVEVDGGAFKPGWADDDSSETTLDIQLQMALAPYGSKILVYEGPNTDSGFLHLLARIADDNTAKQISCSWGSDEGSNTSGFLQSEHQIFQQMAAQGQSFYAASGDSGAYDDGSSLSVDDPASQPYVTGVGGTQLSLSLDGSYAGETTWNAGSAADGAGGGGVSRIWSLPTYQQGMSGLASKQKRNVPDVALNSDPDTGYAIYYQGFWSVYGGTSSAAPLWAAYTANINRLRQQASLSQIGFMNHRLYAIGKSDAYGLAFHDVADNSDNLKYKAAVGYDNATGWGSMNGGKLSELLVSDQYAQSDHPSVSLLTPNGGEIVAFGNELEIGWSSDNLTEKQRLKLYFSKNNGKKWSLLRTRLAINGSLSWKPKKSKRTTAGLLKICLPKSKKSAAVCDQSDTIFSIR
ncbi:MULTISPECIES: S53 family peptidase [Methylomonas]|uniref:S53 family peptidase n=1 Tax=Methylomonas TaxID=416 RepID=UPI00168164B5|nr:S53 family peptidase [Methylomonas rhizoryzae]